MVRLRLLYFVYIADQVVVASGDRASAYFAHSIRAFIGHVILGCGVSPRRPAIRPVVFLNTADLMERQLLNT